MNESLKSDPSVSLLPDESLSAFAPVNSTLSRTLTIARSVRQFGSPGPVRLPVLLLGILTGVLAPADGAAAQKMLHAGWTGWHSAGNRARRLVAAGSGRRRQRRGRRHRRRNGARRRVLAVEALQVRQQP